MQDDDILEAKYMTPKEIAAAYGVHVKTIYRWIGNGQLKAEKPSNKKGGALLIPKALLRHEIPPDGSAKPPET